MNRLKTAESIVFVGPDYKNHRGGIGAVLEVYERNVSPFKFIPSFQPSSSFGKIKIFVDSVFLFFSELLSDSTIRIIHIHGSHGASVYRKLFFVVVGKFFFGKKIIYHLHSSSFNEYYTKGNFIYKWLCRNLINLPDIVITLSPWWSAYVQKSFSAKNVQILNNVIEEKNRGRANRSIEPPLKVLFLGRIGDRKGVFDLLEVIALNKAAWVGKLAFIFGGDGEIERFTQCVQRERLEDLVNYLGWVTGEEKERLLSEADILVLPSYNEGLPISILEAMGYGLPIISTNIGGIPEVVLDGQNGYIITPGDKKELAGVISRYLQQPELTIKQGVKSLEMIKDFYPAAVFSRLEMIYDSLVK